jgi:hypothetical protein
LLERGKKTRANPGQDRIVVAPQHDIYELFRDYAQAQLDIGKMMVVRRFDEALRLLGLRDPNFQPLMRRAPLEI